MMNLKQILNKSIVAVLLAFVLVLAGCGNGGSNNQSSSNEAGSSSVESSSSTQESSSSVEESTKESESSSEAEPEPAPEPAPVVQPTPVVQPAPATPASPNGFIVTIDPGHQATINSEREPMGPGSSETKVKEPGGTGGVASGLREYQLTLQVGLKLQAELINRGYTVVMTRTSNDVNLGNIDRATIANQAGSHAFIRLHADGAGTPDAYGATALCQTAANPYNAAIADRCYALSAAVLNNYVAATGCRSRGVSRVDNMSGINWSQVPVTIFEMGFMTNPQEDLNMASEAYQAKMVQGIANGIDQFLRG